MSTDQEQKITELQRGINMCHVTSKSLAVKTAPDLNRASEALKLCNQYIKAVHDDFDGPIQKAFQAHRAMTALREKHLAPVERAKALINSKVSAYQQDEQRRLRVESDKRIADAREKKRKEEEAAREREKEQREKTAAHLKEAGEEEAADAILEEPIEIPEAPVEVAPVVEEEKPEGLHFRANWKYRVIDIKKIPEQYLIIKVDDKMLKQLAKKTEGTAKVEGVEFFNEPIPIQKS